MRKNQIDPAAMNVKRFTQVLHRHCRAFQMPAGSAFAKRRGPARLAFFFRPFPQNEVARGVFFLFVGVDTRARLIAFDFQSRKPAILRKRTYAEVERAFAIVGVLLLGKPVHQLDHLRYVIGRPRHHLGSLDIERSRVFEEGVGVKAREVAKSLTRFESVADYLVVDVGYVHHVVNFIAEILQIAAEHVYRNESSEVSDVTVVVNRRTARVHPHRVALKRRELFVRARKRVSQFEHLLVRLLSTKGRSFSYLWKSVESASSVVHKRNWR